LSWRTYLPAYPGRRSVKGLADAPEQQVRRRPPPSLVNWFISMLKETSLVFNISVVEIMAQSKIVASRSFRFF
jgi:hypothetical protein